MPAIRTRPDTLPTGLLLAGAGGFLDAYTFVGRGGVFANAQTGNIVLLGVEAGERHLARGVAACTADTGIRAGSGACRDAGPARGPPDRTASGPVRVGPRDRGSGYRRRATPQVPNQFYWSAGGVGGSGDAGPRARRHRHRNGDPLQYRNY
jgi:hypothetical protein